MRPSSRLLIVLVVGAWPLSAGLLIGAAVRFGFLPRILIFPLIPGIAVLSYLGVRSLGPIGPEANEEDFL